MYNRAFYIVNAITWYRLVAAPVLIFLAFDHQPGLFKWLLAVSFFTDAIDGYLARRYKVSSSLGSILDSIADDCTIIAAVIGLLIYKFDFIRQEFILLSLLLGLYILQLVLALIRYGKLTSFHTYLAKAAAIMQGIFLLLMFFLAEPSDVLFYAAAMITLLDLAEEIILVLVLRRWRTNVKGLYWVIKEKAQNH